MNKLTVKDVVALAQDTLEWNFPGFTEYDEKTDTEYRVDLLGESRYSFTAGGMQRPQIFRIGFVVQEEL